MTTVTFDSYEIVKMVELDAGNGTSFFEPWNDESEGREDWLATHWSLYGHLPDGGVEHLSDCSTMERAFYLYSSLTGVKFHAFSGLLHYYNLPVSYVSRRQDDGTERDGDLVAFLQTYLWGGQAETRAMAISLAEKYGVEK